MANDKEGLRLGKTGGKDWLILRLLTSSHQARSVYTAIQIYQIVYNFILLITKRSYIKYIF